MSSVDGLWHRLWCRVFSVECVVFNVLSVWCLVPCVWQVLIHRVDRRQVRELLQCSVFSVQFFVFSAKRVVVSCKCLVFSI